MECRRVCIVQCRAGYMRSKVRSDHWEASCSLTVRIWNGICCAVTKFVNKLVKIKAGVCMSIIMREDMGGKGLRQGEWRQVPSRHYHTAQASFYFCTLYLGRDSATPLISKYTNILIIYSSILLATHITVHVAGASLYVQQRSTMRLWPRCH